MKRGFPRLCLLALMLPAWLFSKGLTVKIRITGAEPATPIEYADESLGQFHIWDGPGTFVNGVAQTKGFIIDWSKGVVAERPAGLERHEVSFYSGCKKDHWGCRTTEPILSYVVTYEYDRSRDQGYVYLPGKSDEWYPLNTFSIYRGGLEGKWFVATAEWREFVQPLIERARANRATR